MKITPNINSTMNPIISLIGLPSCNKSIIINQLIQHKLIRNTQFYGRNNIFNYPDECFNKVEINSKDYVPISIIVVPNAKLSTEWINYSDLVYWVTEAETAFSCDIEKSEFELITHQLLENTNNTGKLCQLAILVIKSNSDSVIDYTQFPNVKIVQFETYQHNNSLCDRLLKWFEVLPLYDRLLKWFEVPPLNQKIPFDVRSVVEYHKSNQITAYFNCLFNNYVAKHLTNLVSHRCEHGSLVLTESCGCTGHTFSDCSLHGTCLYGADKLNDTECNGFDKCEYHRKNQCFYGYLLSEDCRNKYKCPQHIRQIFRRMKEIWFKINNDDVEFDIELDQFAKVTSSLLRFMLIKNQSETDQFYDQHKNLTRIPYSDVLLNYFSKIIGYDGYLDNLLDQPDMLGYREDEWNLNPKNPNILYRLIQLVGLNHIEVVKYWIELTKNGSEYIDYLSITYQQPINIDNYDPNKHPKLFEYDYLYRQNCVMVDINHNKLIKKIKKTRKQLWGSREKDVNSYMLTQYISKGCKCDELNSVLAPIDFYLR